VKLDGQPYPLAPWKFRDADVIGAQILQVLEPSVIQNVQAFPGAQKRWLQDVCPQLVVALWPDRHVSELHKTSTQVEQVGALHFGAGELIGVIPLLSDEQCDCPSLFCCAQAGPRVKGHESAYPNPVTSLSPVHIALT